MVAAWVVALVTGASATTSADLDLQLGYDSNVSYSSLTELMTPETAAQARDGYTLVHPQVFFSGALAGGQIWLGYDLGYTQYFNDANGYRLGQQLRFGGDARLESFSVGVYFAGVDYQASAFHSDRMRVGEAGLVARREIGPVQLELNAGLADRFFPFRPIGPNGQIDRLEIGALTARLPLSLISVSATYRAEVIDSNDPTLSGDHEVLSAGAQGAWRGWRAELSGEVNRYHLPDFPVAGQSQGRLDSQFGIAGRFGYALRWFQPYLYALAETGTSDDPDLVFRRLEAGVGLEVKWSDIAESPALQTPRLASEGRTVAFRFTFPNAKDVRLVGSFNRWDPNSLPMLEVKPGRFEATLPLAPGKYRYQLVVDGERQTPPDAQAYAPDGMGGMDGVLVVPAASNRPEDR